MRIVIIIATAALWLGLALPASAQQAQSGTSTVYYSLSHDDMAGFLATQGFATVEQTEPGTFRVTTDTGFKMTIEQRICDAPNRPPGCLGVSISALWGMEPGQRPALETVATQFNANYSIAKILFVGESIGIERYVITDGGITLEHLNYEMNEFIGISGIFLDTMLDALGL